MTIDQAIKILEGAIKKPNAMDGYVYVDRIIWRNNIMKKIIHNFILMAITFLTFFYVFAYIFVTGIFEKTSTLGSVVWCVCALWLVTFFYANIRETRR